MTIKKRMFVSAALTTASLLAIVALSLYTVLKIKSDISLLTGQSAPLQVKTLELQQTIEGISADFLRLGMSSEKDEIKRSSDEITLHIKYMETLNSEIKGLGSSTPGVDTAVFKKVHKDVIQGLEEKLSNVSLFKAEASNVNAALRKVENIILEIRSRITGLNSEAVTSVNKAQQSNLVINNTVKKLLLLQTKLKDLEVVMSDMETVRNKFKLSPIREKVRAITDSIRAVSYEKGEPTVTKEIKDAVSDIYEQFTKNNGLIALKTELLSNNGNTENNYQTLKKEILKTLDVLNLKLSESIDPLEIQLKKERQKMEESFGFQNNASDINAIGNMINIDLKELNNNVRLIMLSGSNAELDKISADMRNINGRMLGNIVNMKKLLTQSGQAKLVKDTDNMLIAIKATNASISRIMSARKSVLVSDASMQKAIDTVKAVSKEQSKLGDKNVKDIKKSQEKVVSGLNITIKGLLTMIIVISLVIVITVSALGMKTTRSITEPIKVTKELIADMSKGDLTRKIEVKDSDEIGDMCKDLSFFVSNLHDAISQVAEKTNAVASNAKGLSSTAEQLSEKAKAQADDAHSLSASADEMSATVIDVAKNAQSASDFSNDIKEKAVKGGDVVKQAIEGIKAVAVSVKGVTGTMDELAKGSDKIGEVVLLIKEIADQTNLLSLNAAIEAARAGEQGRGFAVVADEVRKLAERTSGATVEISGMINSIQADSEKALASVNEGLVDVESAVALANKAGGALNEIVQGVEKIAEMMGHIAAASNEQSSTVDMMASNITHVADVAREFTSGTAQSAKATDDLDRIALELQELVSRFKI